jgi:parvulin-like peptidyl-prolyl isomerase
MIWSCDKNTIEPESGVVASVGSFQISDAHFQNHLKRFYLRTGQAANINEDFRLAVVNARIERYAIVEHAKELGWATDADAVYNKSMIERKVLMEEYQRRFIYDRLQITDNELREIFRRYNTTIRASHLRANTYQEAQDILRKLNAGQSFESLANQVFEDPALASTGGDLGYFTIDEMDVAFEAAAYSMQLGEISQPVKTSTGYSIIKITDLMPSPIITEYQFAQRKPALEQIARYQKQELATRGDIENVVAMMSWDASVVDFLWDLVSINQDAYASQMVELSEIPLPLQDADRGKVIANYRGFNFTVQDFLVESFYTPFTRRRNIQNKVHFIEQIQGLAYRSFALGLINNHPQIDKEFIKGSIDETFYGYLFERFEAEIDRKVTVPESALLNAYNANPDLFNQPLKLEMSEIVLTDSELAGAVFKKLQAGEDFHSMLSKYGADTQTKRNDGYIGNLPITDFGLMASGLQNIRPGEVAGPFQVSTNYFIVLKCNGRTEPKSLRFDEAKPAVMEYVKNSERQAIRDRVINELRTQYNAYIDMKRLNSLSFQM